MKRIILAASMVSLLFASGCSGMTAEQAARAKAALDGAVVLAGAVANLPVPPGMEDAAWAKQSKYWANYASGVLKVAGEAAAMPPFSSAALSPVEQSSSTKAE